MHASCAPVNTRPKPPRIASNLPIATVMVQAAAHGRALCLAQRRSSVQVVLARDLCCFGRHEEAEPLLREAQTVPPRATMRVLGPSVEALLAERGDFEQPEARARKAAAAAEAETDAPFFEAWAYEDLATVLERAGRIEEALGALERALEIWELKRCLPCADRTRERIDSLGSPVPVSG